MEIFGVCVLIVEACVCVLCVCTCAHLNILVVLCAVRCCCASRCGLFALISAGDANREHN